MRCCVTGGSGFVGQRLVEMLVERGAERVVSFDILPQPPTAWQETKLDEKKKPKVSKVTLIVVMVYARGAVSPPTDSERHLSGGLGGKASENF